MGNAQQSVIVIGSGIGGSAIGALLSHRGYKVTVLEKLNIYHRRAVLQLGAGRLHHRSGGAHLFTVRSGTAR